MSHPTSPSAAHSATSAMTSSLTDGVVDSRFFATKKISMYKLQRFLDTDTVLPSSQVSDTDGVLHENPEFVRYEQ
ncbi:hypothetical protein PVK06_039686 [Gossypium arboreum]|uniref:Uncharacterized protein n=1 Tax=Gossypium arboreum TaxID=29729 RepID=A0ABR0N3J5_GOSAR|nr:hypothetical protein PVK06_039686 [Gossypium arboreum]